jgi:hypothetical protein
VDGIVSLGGMDSFLLFDVNFKTVSGHYTPLLFVDGVPHQLVVDKDLTVDEQALIVKYVKQMKKLAKNWDVPLQAILTYYAHPKRYRRFKALIQMNDTFKKIDNKTVVEKPIQTIFQKRQHMEYLGKKYNYTGRVGYCRSDGTIIYRNDFKKYMEENHPHVRLQ